jgi:transcription initiation factor TFIID subunit 12
MAVDKKQRLVPGAMYIPPTPTASSSSKAGASPASAAKALTPNKPLGELLKAIDPRFCFQPAVEELLLDMASDFVEDVVAFSSRLAKHRRSTELQPKDLQFCLAKNYGISLAGAGDAQQLNPLGADVVVRARPAKNSLHMHRVALKRKTLQRTAAKLKKGGAVKVSGSGDAAAAAGRKVVHRKPSTAPDAK